MTWGAKFDSAGFRHSAYYSPYTDKAARRIGPDMFKGAATYQDAENVCNCAKATLYACYLAPCPTTEDKIIRVVTWTATGAVIGAIGGGAAGGMGAGPGAGIGAAVGLGIGVAIAMRKA